MSFVKRMVYVAGVAMVLSLAATSGVQASIVECDNSAVTNPTAGTCNPGPHITTVPSFHDDDAVAYMNTHTSSTDLEFFAKYNDGGGSPKTATSDGEPIAGEANKVTVTETNDNLWHLSWAGLVNWDLKFIMVVDGVDCPGCDKATYLFAMTSDQFNTGSGDVYVKNLAGQLKGISHIYLFGVNEESSVPEPTTLLLLGAGLLGTAVVARRRK